MWIIPSNVGFQYEEAHFAMYYAIVTAVRSVRKQMRIQALGRQADATKERMSKELACLSCVSFQTQNLIHSSTSAGSEVRRQKKARSVTLEKLPPQGKKCWEWEVLFLVSFSLPYDILHNISFAPAYCIMRCTRHRHKARGFPHCRNTACNTWSLQRVCEPLFMSSVRLPVNSGLLAVKLFGRSQSSLWIFVHRVRVQDPWPLRCSRVHCTCVLSA